MKKITIFSIVFFISYSISSQEFMKKIQLKEGLLSDIKYNDLNITPLLQVYNDGNISLKVKINNESIANFHINCDNTTSDSERKEYYTKVYKNNFLTFKIENNNKYLIIEQAKFGKAFALSSSDGVLTISNKDDLIEIEITDYIHEWGYDAPPEDPNRNYFTDVQYTLKVKVKNVVKNFLVSSAELQSKGSFSIDLGSYNIIILSDQFGHKSSLIEMIIDKK
ncbi:hypothetical protein ATE84_3827 [Aquimarina sp. MAR_2010_214]|uniref:hypothetical protein n=1 Tax=Aquimarina sp. MAR_2010_214 TaxID=1250026 RepID=UPI000C711D6F|nr:hypothetical protein [Aquimarina sp. MAR_2010_214]PKV51729.1 hypothetical protein ATE84_3827 [Aquimarina sp. MAR_2010_214]